MAPDAAPEASAAWPPELASARWLRLTTYDADGTPASVAERFTGDEGSLWVVTSDHADEVARVRTDPRACVVASDAHGAPAGQEVQVEVVLHTGEETQRVARLLDRKYGVQAGAARVWQRLRGGELVGLELRRKA